MLFLLRTCLLTKALISVSHDDALDSMGDACMHGVMDWLIGWLMGGGESYGLTCAADV